MAAATVYLQDECYKHQYIRTSDLSCIVERPERIRAVKVGVAGAVAQANILHSKSKSKQEGPDLSLEDALERLNIGSSSPAPGRIAIARSTASVDLLHHPAVKFVHGDIDGDKHIPRLVKLAAESTERIRNGESEIPAELGWKQGDVYLCPESVAAMEGAAGTVVEAVDAVLLPGAQTTRAFAVIRPPGHHCGEDTPEGFCFINNVAIAAAHAHLKHGVNRAVIFDIDLHHGNGTQSIAWQINEETYRQTLESEGGAPHVKPGPMIFYGSVHDILSYPCEDGTPNLVQAASVSIHGAHGQHIENVHLEAYEDEERFHGQLYAKYSTLLSKAERFLDTTGENEDCIFFISCGMDACEHEYASMSRHNRKVPVSFYHRFTRDVCALADRRGKGRVVSVLEGGYSDRALISGAMAHVLGLAGVGDWEEGRSWWGEERLKMLENATKPKKRGGRPSRGAAASPADEDWVQSAAETFRGIDEGFVRCTPPLPSRTSTRLRGRGGTPTTSPGKPVRTTVKANLKAPVPVKQVEGHGGEESELSELTDSEEEEEEKPKPKTLPRVVLKLGPDPAVGGVR
ncbi:Arginase/deacetylase [Cylindrobasidium torrendii FP15055 ss-10]|uniref:Arginase/deacetylase n=1 Tax=Cylindrobasidium torrendii FP15055 ss-10 TaxID=1314674 RepID=A0A0D7ATT8_9AGAR|nr:Arginase/deacetylase [Cylindrobasidium torrendii FP15055 ss-10]